MCSCEGKTHHASVAPDEGNIVSKKTKLIPIIRSDCKAIVKLKLDREWLILREATYYSTHTRIDKDRMTTSP